MSTLRVLLIADDPLVRAGLAALLADIEECEVVGQVAPDDDLALAPDLFLPDVALWDLGWAPTPDLEQLTDFAELALPLLVLLDDADLAAGVLATGVRGLLSRRTEGAQLEAGLRGLRQGLLVVGPELIDDLLDGLTIAPPPLDLLIEPLTPREMEVLQLLAEGAANKEIARRLSISENTVKYHVNAILGKLDAQSRTEAVVRATRVGLILL